MFCITKFKMNKNQTNSILEHSSMLDKSLSSNILIIMADEQEEPVAANDATLPHQRGAQQQHNLVVPWLPNQVHAQTQAKRYYAFFLISWNGNKEDIHYQMIMCSQMKRRDQSALMTSINTSA